MKRLNVMAGKSWQESHGRRRAKKQQYKENVRAPVTPDDSDHIKTQAITKLTHRSLQLHQEWAGKW